MDKAAWEKFKQRFGRVLDLGELKEVTGGKSFDYEELLRNSIFWGHLSYVDPSLPKCDYYAQWDRMGIKFEIRNGEYVYTDKETGAKVDFFGAWALVLKRFEKKDDVARTTAISRISEKLAEMKSYGKQSRQVLKEIKNIGKRGEHGKTIHHRNRPQVYAEGRALGYAKLFVHTNGE